MQPLSRTLLVALLAGGVLAGCEQVGDPVSVSEEDTSSPELFAGKAGAAIEGQYIVVLKDEFAPGNSEANRDRAAEVARGLGLSPKHTYGTALFGFSAAIPEGRLKALRNDPRVAYVEADAVVSLPIPRTAAPPWAGGGGGSTGEVIPWGIDRTGAGSNLDEGAGIHVYVIDTGIDTDHPDLQANISPDGFASETCKGGGCNYPWDDDHDHGTHVAGTIGAVDNDRDVLGMASKVTLHAVKVLSKAGSGSRSGVIAGIDWVTKHVKDNALGGKAVANMSLGGSGSKTGTCSASGFSGTDSYHQAICNSARAGVVYAVAAGNDGADAQGAVPAAYDDAVITVSATTCSVSNNKCGSGTDDWTSWSNWGDNGATLSGVSVTYAPVSIAAPGASILSTKRGGGTTTMSGTSMASPHAAGAIALYLESNAQAASYSAFDNARKAIIVGAEETSTWKNTSGNPHAEDFLKAGSL